MTKKSRPEFLLNSFEDVDNVISKIKEKAIELKKQGYRGPDNKDDNDAFHEMFFDLVGHFLITSQSIKTSSLSSFRLYRARNASQVKKIESLSEYSCPPRDLKVGIGRANWNGQNVFYASFSPYGALSELKEIDNGTEYFVSEWTIDLSKYAYSDLFYTSYYNADHSKDKFWINLLSFDEQKVRERLIQVYGDKWEIGKYLHDEFGKLFVHPEDDYYCATAFLASHALNGAEQHPVLPKMVMYPSVLNDENLNFAIDPSFVEEFMKMKRVLKIKVNDQNVEGYNVTPTRVGQIELNKVSLYQTSINLDDIHYSINELKCCCSNPIRFDDPEKLLLVNKDSKETKTLKELAEKEINRIYDPKTYDEVLNDWFKTKSLPVSINVDYQVPLDGYSILRQGKNHVNLFVKCSLQQRIKYFKKGRTPNSLYSISPIFNKPFKG